MTSTTTEAGPDLDAFLMAHRGFRAEFGRLAGAARAVRDEAHAALVDDQIELVMHLLHHHHTGEDTSVWPRLVERLPAAKPALDRLEAQHAEMDPLFAAVTDRSRPVTDRADDLLALHEVLNAHLDEEEREAVPLIRAHFTPAEWDAGGEEVMESLDRKRLPLIFGWLASASTQPQTETALRGVPLAPRILFKLIWGPAYEKRFAELYGTDATYGPNPRRVLS
ncbi:MAG: hemerythrin domain-containing protein [Actinomycetes bacterium]